MPNKTYGQLCPIARAMDVLGDRWTLLLIRELLLGPKRFKDLLATLPAMGPNRLSDRLAILVDSGVIRQSPPPRPFYELTELGEQLRKPVIALGLWGLKLPIDKRIDPSSARAELAALCMTGASNPYIDPSLDEVIQFEVGKEIFHIQYRNGEAFTRSGSSTDAADVQVRCDLSTFMELALRKLTPLEAVRDGRASLLRGSQRAFTKLFSALKPTS